MSNERIRISRRKALVGLGSIGLASAGAGLGTYAQFTDREQNSATFTAGGIDGKISWSGSYNGNPVSDQLENVRVEGNEVMGDVHFTDVKPGDYGCVNFGIEVENNPAWVASCLRVKQDIDNRIFEPELEADDDIPDDAEVGDTGVQSPGELAANMYTIPYYDNNGKCTFFESSGPVTPEEDGATTAGAFWKNSQPDAPVIAEGETEEGERYRLAPRTVHDVVNNVRSLDTAHWSSDDQSLDMIEAPGGASVRNGCVMLEGDAEDENEDDNPGNNTQGVSPLPPDDDAVLNFGYDFHLPFETGNAAQGDRLTITLGFKFLQVRHTEAPQFGSYSPGSNTPGEGDTGPDTPEPS